MLNVFIGSSSESKIYAEIVAAEIRSLRIFDVVCWWDEGIFKDGDAFLESLFAQIKRTDLAVMIAGPDDILQKRGREAPTLRDNILFEYGIFAGNLGRHSVGLLVLGNNHLELPSDLNGVTRAFCQIDYSPGAIQIACSDLSKLREQARGLITKLTFACRDQPLPYRKVLNLYGDDPQFRRSFQDINALYSANLSLTNCVDGNSKDYLLQTLHSLTVQQHKAVGTPGHKTEVEFFIDFTRADDSQLHALAHSLHSLASNVIGDERPNTVAYHWKSDSAGMMLLSITAKQCGLSTVLVRTVRGNHCESSCRLQNGDSFIFLHDVVTSAFTPILCINHLRKEARAAAVVALAVREKLHLETVEKFRMAQTRFFPLSILKEDGTVELIEYGGTFHGNSN